jgi:hypothetical protein
MPKESKKKTKANNESKEEVKNFEIYLYSLSRKGQSRVLNGNKEEL